MYLFLQVDELYEGFCIQRRLRDGASKMKQAFTASPSTKGARESLTEVNRRYKEYTEVISFSLILSQLCYTSYTKALMHFPLEHGGSLSAFLIFYRT